MGQEDVGGTPHGDQVYREVGSMEVPTREDGCGMDKDGGGNHGVGGRDCTCRICQHCGLETEAAFVGTPIC